MVLDRLPLLRGRLARLKEGLFRGEEADGPGFRWRYFLKVFLLLLLAQLLISSWPYYTTMRQLRLTVETNERYIVQMEREFIQSHFAVVFTDIEYLVQSYRLVDASMRNPAARNAHLEQQYLNFLKNKGIYDQARIIDLRGMETVRTNYNDGKPAVIPRQQLQMKSDRYYFKEGLKLREREIIHLPPRPEHRARRRRVPAQAHDTVRGARLQFPRGERGARGPELPRRRHDREHEKNQPGIL